MYVVSRMAATAHTKKITVAENIIGAEKFPSKKGKSLEKRLLVLASPSKRILDIFTDPLKRVEGQYTLGPFAGMS